MDNSKTTSEFWGNHFPKTLKLSLLMVLLLTFVGAIEELVSGKTYEKVPIAYWYQFFLYGLYATVQLYPFILGGFLLFFHFRSKRKKGNKTSST